MKNPVLRVGAFRLEIVGGKNHAEPPFNNSNSNQGFWGPSVNVREKSEGTRDRQEGKDPGQPRENASRQTFHKNGQHGVAGLRSRVEKRKKNDQVLKWPIKIS